jgi:hypothetical protein
MVVNYVSIKGYIRGGKLEVELPENVVEGEAEVIVPIAAESNEGVMLGDILASGLVGSGADWDIGDSEEWIQEQRRKTWEERRKSWTAS